MNEKRIELLKELVQRLNEQKLDITNNPEEFIERELRKIDHLIENNVETIKHLGGTL